MAGQRDPHAPARRHSSVARPRRHERGAWALYLLERHEEVLGDAERAVSLAADNADYLGTEGHVLAALGRRQDALAAFERAMAVADTGWVGLYQEALTGHGYYSGAIHGAYDPATRAALQACLEAGCRLIE